MKIVSRGKLRVDARRAVAKLREHLLVDLHDYSVELARAATASRAPALAISFDADDVVFGWDGDDWDHSALDRLLDHVLVDANDSDVQRLRLLAIAVNAALGLDPVRVDVVAARPGGAVRWRYTPQQLASESEPEREALSERPERRLEVRLRRRLGWGVLTAAALRTVPREIEALLQCAKHGALPISVNGRAWSPPSRRAPVATLALAVAGAEAELLVFADGDGPPVLRFFECGLLLATQVFEPTELAARDIAVALPVEIHVRARSLPTNASRSAVRSDSELYGACMTAVAASWSTLVAALARVVTASDDPPPDGFELLQPDRAEAVLGVLLRLSMARPSPLADQLMALPLFRDGAGGPKSYADIVASGAGRERPLFVHRADEPLDPELLPLLRDVLWLRGTTAEAVLHAFHCQAADDVVALAREGLARRRQLLAIPAGRVAVADSPAHILRQTFALSEGRFTGLHGEIALRSDGRRSTLRIFHEGREIVATLLPDSLSAVGIDVALAWDAGFVVRLSYDGVEDGPALRSAIWCALQVAVEAAAELENAPEAVMGVLAVAAAAAEALAVPAELRRRIDADHALWQLPAWRTTEAGRFVSTAEIAELLARRGALCVAGPERRGTSRDERVVLALSAREREWLAAVLDRDLPLVPYAKALTVGIDAGAIDAALRRELLEQGIDPAATVVSPIGGHSPGVIAVAWRSAEILFHAGHELAVDRLFGALFGPVVLVRDDPSIVPTPAWDAVLTRAPVIDSVAYQRRLLEQVVARVSQAAGQRDVPPLLAAYLIRSAAYIHPSPDNDAVRADLQVLPLVPMADRQGRVVLVSLATVASTHDGIEGIPLLGAAPGFATLDWHPVIASGEIVDALRVWSGGRLESADGELSVRRAMAKAHAARELLLAQPQLSPDDLGDRVPANSLIGRHSEDGGFALAALSEGDGVVEVLLERRLVIRGATSHYLPLPLHARVGVDDESLFASFETLTSRGLREVCRLLTAAAVALAEALLSAPGSSLGDPRILRLVRALLLQQVDASVAAAPLRRALRSAPVWPTIRGGLARIRDGRRSGADVLVARRRYADWVEGSGGQTSFDRPILWLPEGHDGEVLNALLDGLAVKQRDVTAAVARVQAQRREGGDWGEPRLPTSVAVAPHLRASLRDLRVTGLAGELALLPAGRPTIHLTDLDGTRVLEGDGAVPFVAVAVSESVASEAGDRFVSNRLANAAERLLGRLSPVELNRSPEGLRHVYRRALRSAIARDHERLSSRQASAEVFPDVRGEWHSLDALQAAVASGDMKQLWVTTDFPPHYEFGRLVLALPADELDAFRPVLPIHDVTKRMRQALRGEQRRSAPSIDLRLSPALRDRCLPVAKSDQGEVALLAPGHDASDLLVCHQGRPVCQLQVDGWPLAGVWNDDSLRPNLAFDGVGAKQAKRVVAEARSIAEAAVKRGWAAPDDALAASWIDASDGVTHVLGWLWLPPRWQRQPELSVRTAAGTVAVAVRGPARSSDSDERAVADLDRTLPLAGMLAVRSQTGSDLLAPVTVAAWDALGNMLRQAAEPGDLRLAWNLALLGLADAPCLATLRVDTASGSLAASSIARHLAAGGTLGFDGDGLRLIQDASSDALCEVLAARGLRSAIAVTAASSPASVDLVDEPAIELAPVAEDAANEAVFETALRPVAQATSLAGLHVTESWLESLVRQAVELVAARPLDPPLDRAHRLLRLVEQRWRRLGLEQDPTVAFAYGRHGGLRYDHGQGVAVLGRKHPLVAELLGSDEPDAVGVAVAVALLLCEVDAAEKGVTPASVMVALEQLLNDPR